MPGPKNYETPPDYFRARWEMHRFNVDAAASDKNALVKPGDSMLGVDGEECDPCLAENVLHYVGRYYTEKTNGLDPSHYVEGDRVWCNPPYDASIIRWVKLARELAFDGGVLWELLLPASTDTGYFDLLFNNTAGHWRDGVSGKFVGRVQFLLDGKLPVDKNGKPQSSRQPNMRVTLWPGGQRS